MGSQVKSRSQSGKAISESPNVINYYIPALENVSSRRNSTQSTTQTHIQKTIEKNHVKKCKTHINIKTRFLRSQKVLGWKCWRPIALLLHLAAQVFGASKIFLDAKMSTSKFQVPNIRQVFKSSSPTPVTVLISPQAPWKSPAPLASKNPRRAANHESPGSEPTGDEHRPEKERREKTGQNSKRIQQSWNMWSMWELGR